MAMREEYTDIRIDKNGVWYTKDQPIVNKKVLFYFKNNLKRDSNGIYIKNKFKNLYEKGYIIVRGPLLFGVRLDLKNKTCLTEINSVLCLKKTNIVSLANGRVYIFLSYLKAWLVLNRSTTLEMLYSLHTKDNTLVWDDIKIPIQKTISWA